MQETLTVDSTANRSCCAANWRKYTHFYRPAVWAKNQLLVSSGWSD